MKDYVTLNDKQKDFVIKEYIQEWPLSIIRQYREYTWIIKQADASWVFHKTHPYILGVQIPEKDDPDFWEEIEAIDENEYKKIMEVQ